MSMITRQDTNGVKPLLQTGELGYDNYPAGGDAGRVWVGTGTENIALAKEIEILETQAELVVHKDDKDNPHEVTKAQVGLGNVDNTEDSVKDVFSATKWTTARIVSLSGDVVGSVSIDGSDDVNIVTTVEDNSHSHIIDNIDGLQSALDDKADQGSTYTKAEVDSALALKVDDTEIASVNLLRADKYLAAQNIANVYYADGNIAKIQYNNATDADYEVFSYTAGDLTNVAHYINEVLQGNTILTYSGGDLVSSVFIGV